MRLLFLHLGFGERDLLRDVVDLHVRVGPDDLDEVLFHEVLVEHLDVVLDLAVTDDF